MSIIPPKTETKPTEITAKDVGTSKTPLSRTFTFWFSFFKQNRTKSTYEDEIKPLGNFNTVEEFWSFYQHIIRPEKLPYGCEFFLFQEGIKPMWEDESNQGGGRFILRLKKNYANRFWEDLILSFIGEQCEENEEICGLVLSVKSNDITISIWTKQITEKVKDTIKQWIKLTLVLSDKMELEFKNHPHPNPTQGGGGGHHPKFHKKLERNEDYRKKYSDTAEPPKPVGEEK